LPRPMTWKNAYITLTVTKYYKKKCLKKTLNTHTHTAESAAVAKRLRTLELLLNSNNNNKRHE